MLDTIEGWEDRPSDTARAQVQWMRAHQATVSLVATPMDALHDLPPAVVLDVTVNQLRVFKMRGAEEEIEGRVEQAHLTVQNRVNYTRRK